MIELYSLNALDAAQKNPDKTPEELRSIMLAKTVMLSIVVLMYIWAFLRALKCSQSNPDSRVIHFGFATISPILYIIFSYTIPGLKPTNYQDDL